MHTDNYKKLSLFHFAEAIQKHHAGKIKRCLIVGNFGAANIGDDAILAGQIEELRSISDLTITVVARFPELIQKTNKVKSISLYNFWGILTEIIRSDFVIVGGGGLICRVHRGIIGWLYQIYFLSISFLLPFFLRKDIYTLGIGVYANTDRFILWLSLHLLRLSRILTVRDYHSYSLLKNKISKVQLFKDMSFFMPFSPKEKVLQEDPFQKQFSNKRVNIGISLVKPRTKEEEKQLLRSLSSFMINNSHNADFWFYACDNHPGYSNDTDLEHSLVDLVKTKSENLRCFFVPTELRPERFFSSFQLMNFFITMRLHASIFSYRTKVPFVGITYDAKCTDFLQSIGKVPVHIPQVTSDLLQNELEKVL